MQKRSSFDFEIVQIYLPPIRDDHMARAQEEMWAIWRLYRITEDDCLLLLRSQRTIFKRLVRIDPVLRRAKYGVAPFATRLVYPARSEAKEALERIHACFDKYGLKREERRTYLHALVLMCLADMHIIQAEVQLRTGSLLQQ